MSILIDKEPNQKTIIWCCWVPLIHQIGRHGIRPPVKLRDLRHKGRIESNRWMKKAHGWRSVGFRMLRTLPRCLIHPPTRRARRLGFVFLDLAHHRVGRQQQARDARGVL